MNNNGKRCNCCTSDNRPCNEIDGWCTNHEQFKDSIDEISDGIGECREDLIDIIRCNIREGIRQEREGIRQMEEGICILKEALEEVDVKRNREQLRCIHQGICGIQEGIKDIR